MFANPRSGLGILVNKPFIKWRKKSECIIPHAAKKYHVDAWQAANDFIQKIENPQLTLSSVTQSNSEENFDRNFGIPKCIIEAVLFCGRQCIAFRTRNESNLDDSVNPGNFLAFLKMVAWHDDALMEHLTSRAMRNATYLSPDIQNELIHIIGKEIVQSEIVEEIKDAKFFQSRQTKLQFTTRSNVPFVLDLLTKRAASEKNFWSYFP